MVGPGRLSGSGRLDAMSQPASPRGTAPTPAGRVRQAAVVSTAPVGLMWGLEGVDTLSGNALDQLGLSSWVPGDLWGVFTSPLVHLGWQHLANNSVPLLVLGFLVALAGMRRWLATTLVVVLTSGITAWLLSPPGTLTLGASGVVFGWLSYLLVRGWWSRDWRQVMIGLVVLALYGGVLWGVLPTDPNISWQGHLGGAAGGVLAAWLQHRRRPAVATQR